MGSLPHVPLPRISKAHVANERLHLGAWENSGFCSLLGCTGAKNIFARCAWCLSLVTAFTDNRWNTCCKLRALPLAFFHPMPPIRTQPLLRGASPSPLSRPAAPKVPSSSSVIPGGGSSSLQPASHVGGGNYASAPDSQSVIFGPNSKNVFSGNPTFLHNTHVHQAHNMRGAIQVLYEHSAPGAVYNSKERFDPPKCHLNTRTRLFNTTRDWTRNGRSRMMWLYGSAGAGKSAVAQTFAMELRAASNLAASFFFSRTAHVNSHRGHEGRFVTTIAYQLAEVVPNLQGYVEHVIVSKPSVFNLALTEQVMALIIEPLKALQLDMASHGGTSCVLPMVVVIDGLDECKEESGQIQVLDALATLVSHQDIFPCSVFLASRPEVAIRSWMTNKQSEDPQLLWSISLLDHCDSDHDIRVFVKNETAKMMQSHPLKYRIPVGWPSPELVKEIIKRASGQFVFADIIIKYIKDLRGHPCERLEAILKHTLPSDDRPYADLDALYLHILRQTKHPRLVHRILAFRITTASFWGKMDDIDSRNYLRMLLSLPYSVHTLLIDLQSIMSVDEDGMQFMGSYKDEKSAYPPVFHHASLLEFLLDPHRSEEFYVDTPSMDKELYETTIRHLGGECACLFRREVSEHTLYSTSRTRSSCGR
ncbi:hypothetical protein BJ165DRAFT_644159 [Panaeolus papilionaceus]|nr:hypothetical protein BJ165DRAFT_644159 [Panaeolus papilionaceus]